MSLAHHRVLSAVARPQQRTRCRGVRACAGAREAATALAAGLLLSAAGPALADLNKFEQAAGGEFGMGAEIGIATGKMHARGPVGVEQLTSFNYRVRGNGQTRP